MCYSCKNGCNTLYNDILIIPNLPNLGFIFFLIIQTQASDIKRKEAPNESKEIQLNLILTAP